MMMIYGTDNTLVVPLDPSQVLDVSIFASTAFFAHDRNQLCHSFLLDRFAGTLRMLLQCVSGLSLIDFGS